jgi:Mn2+/Fe2+ NRAMP family transporter
MQARRRSLNLDKIGAYASAVCAVHCFLTGIAIGLLSVIGLGFLNNIISDIVFLGIALLVGVFAIWHGIRRHRSYLPATVFVAALGLISVGHFAFGHSHDHVSPISTVFNVLGGLALVAFHLINWKMQQARPCCHETHCEHTGGLES